MRFSEFFEIEPTSEDDWFDPVLSLDTKLFIDPFLIYADEIGPFVGSHAEIVEFFNQVFQHIARSQGNRHSLHWRRAETLLIFPEAEEFCLGYTSEGTGGAGSGVGFAKAIADALWEAVQAGVKEITHFEEVSILREGIGADRISDITATILRHRFAKYTKEVCERHNIKIEKRMYRLGFYDSDFDRWQPASLVLPLNPYNERPILLTPKRYIRDLPTISDQEFWDYCLHNENETLRLELGMDITKNVDKKTIVRFASQHPEIRSNFIEATEEDTADPYNFWKDPKGLVRWYDVTAKHCKENPLQLDLSNQKKFLNAVNSFIHEFNNYVVNNRGWRLLWNDSGRPKSEEATQLLFLGIVKHYCKANDIDITRESNIGRGPVDFKASKGYMLRTLLEVKLANNTKFWDGLEKQLPKYMVSEQIDNGFFIVVVYRENDLKRIENIKYRIDLLNKRVSYSISHVIVDARRDPLSASKL